MIDLLDFIEDGIGLLLMSVIWVVVLLQVVVRIIGHSLPWTEELSRYVFIWICFIGASAGIRTRQHAGMTFLLDWAGPRLGPIVVVLLDILFLVFAAAMCLLGVQFTISQLIGGQMGSALAVPLYAVSAAVPVGMALACRNLVRLIAHDLSKLRPERG